MKKGDAIMPGKSLTPQEMEYKKIISSRLNELLLKSGKKKSDITRQTGLPASTLTGYFGGKRLPSEENVVKLASFFNVSEDYIDPRLDPNIALNSHRDTKEDDEKPLTRNQKLIAYSIDPDISDEERQAIIEMVQAAKKFRRRI
ncbi:helix-turn-helix domain-containing protein [Limosilactobacillus mucosae]|uniref:helix-turn-helix domain-containing protein n=1 Tax=Limosilactobacillus mucosae TaxID=97478 RepID=UPI00233ED370|nr:helix-turn-helix transcriptional regulator [Limosilactobacillus mucosae]MDC2841875.1 helix-turn-helix transcriptional regulator [Limosilactobacillus mucosae]